jgi:formylglycine-generating enzyme required for sulfatase activity/tRNA A-37 threonylcarbamoyl transferase component Bud32
MSGQGNADSSAIDSAADRFERAWKGGQAPRIEEFLEGVSGERRDLLFEELLIVERELRSRNGELPDVEGYRHRFPDMVEVIDRNFVGPDSTRATEIYPGGMPTTADDALPGPRGDGMTQQPPQASDPRYRVLRHHADGGVGRVNVALDLELRRQVALKELQDRFADDPQFRARFLLEVEITGRLEHPGVIPVYSLGRDERGRPFYAMRFIEGEDLEQAINSFHAADRDPDRDRGKQALALRELLRRFIDVCNVVAYAHSRGVLHRDLKPGNILLGPYGETLVVDWGMAKRVDELLTAVGSGDDRAALDPESAWNVTQQGYILGTIPYMSPEQAEGGPLGIRSDVYSLGATLYHIVAGKPTIAKGDKYAMLATARRGDFAPPRRINHRVPGPLDAICQKAMSGNPDDRYVSARALADDIEHWLADEPVAAWNEPWFVRVRRWVGRHRTAVAAAVAALAVGAVGAGHLFHDYRVRSAERKAAADGLLVALKAADISQVEGIVNQLAPLRPLVLDRLLAMTRGGPTETSGSRRNAALAVLADDSEQAEYLVERIVRTDVHPREITVVRQALLAHGRASILAPRLWRLLREGSHRAPANLGAAGMLALFRPHDPAWDQFAASIARTLVMKGPLFIGEWREVFQPIEHHLVAPLRAVFGATSEPREARALAFSLLLDFAVQPGNTSRDPDLAELIGDASPEEFREITRGLGQPKSAITVLLAKLDQPRSLDQDSARREGKIAAALIVLGSPDRAWPLLSRGRSHDIGIRAELVHDFAKYGIDPGSLANELASQSDPATQRALVLALGYYTPETIAPVPRSKLLQSLRDLYVRTGDPGIRSAIEWLVRTRWSLGQELDRLERPARAHELVGDRDWFVNSEGVTMAVIRAGKPLEVDVGSPEDEDGRDSDERLHRVRLERSFAIATREVTGAQFERFLRSEPGARAAGDFKRNVSSPDCPVIGVDWLSAAAYCNWRSRQENLHPYYVIEGTTLTIRDQDGLGYRLPTEHEWEFACRAGSKASRPYGASEALLENYAWYVANGAKHSHPVGRKEPNDLGLFDMLGNAFEWTQDRYLRDHDGSRERSAQGGANVQPSAREIEVVLRGGSFNSPATALRCAYRERSSPSDPLETYGFRYVRTLPPVRKP